MKNLKKVLAVVLAFAMIIGTNVFAASFPDLDKTANYAEAVSVLADLGILTGYSDGTIQPEGDITRAEFAAIVCRIKGLENAANSAKGTTVFTDVAADHWASGYINMASQQGIINGVGNGLFLPEENVKFEEAVKMVVAALGYTPKAEGMGAYPTGYLAVASQIGVTTGVSGVNGEAANRGTVARLAYNALDVPIMEQVSYGTGSIQYAPGDSILLDSLDLVKVEATILAIPGSTGNSNDLQADQVRLHVDKHYIAYDGKLYISDPEANNTYSDLSWVEDKVRVGTTDAQSYLNKPVIAYLEGAYDDEVTIRAIVEKSSRIDEVSFKSEDIYPKYTDMSKTTPEVAFYDDETSSSSYTRATIDPTDFSLYVNDINFATGEAYIRDLLGNESNKVLGSTALETFQNFIEEAQVDEPGPLGFNVTLLNNDTDSEFDVAYIEYYTDMVVDLVNANTYRVTAQNTASAIYLDPTERNASFTIENADGTEASFDDIKSGSVLSIRKGIVESNKLITGNVIILDDNTVSGKITEISDSDKEIAIDGTTYSVETRNEDINFNNLKTNTEATFYINARGNIFYLDKSAIVSNMKVGFATKIGSTSGISSSRQIQMMNEDGEFVVYDLANKVTINESGSSVTSTSEDFTQYEVLAFETTASQSNLPTRTIGGDDDLFVLNAPVTYDLNSNGEVYKLNLLPNKGKVLDQDGYGYTAYQISGSTYNVNTDAAGGVYMTDNTILFSIDAGDGVNYATDTTIDENDITVMKKDGLVDSQEINAFAVNCDDDSNAKALFGVKLVNALVANSNLMVVTSTATTTNSDGDTVTRLTGLMNGETVQVYVGDDTDRINASSITKGDVVVYQSGAGEELKAIAKIFSASAQFNGNDVTEPTAVDLTDSIIPGLLDEAPNGDSVQFYFGYARNLRGSNLTLVTSDDFDADAENADATKFVEVTFKSANVVVYDKFEGKDPRIEESDLADVDYDREVANDIAGDFVFVRVIDDIAKDAVIIKTNH